ncbi:hypothetical protein NDU88_006485 [Pleurodeles waltl]|uniref:Uncharacterized protein n=1 Tax=Pleurodeles waltl TaxID=8319 RepID=A0AAV7TE27_PLEWA|nr:hypothetical protein NDU88_006485 [Pleurodeles waltl]
MLAAKKLHRTEAAASRDSLPEPGVNLGALMLRIQKSRTSTDAKIYNVTLREDKIASNLRIVGLPEKKATENVADYVEMLLKMLLGTYHVFPSSRWSKHFDPTLGPFRPTIAYLFQYKDRNTALRLA